MKLPALVRAGFLAVILHPLRSAASIACIVAVLTPYAGGLAVSRGMIRQARSAIEGGADLHVAGRRFGRPVPVPLAALETLRALPGGRSVTPRIVGEASLGTDQVPVVVVGLPAPNPGVKGLRVASSVNGRLYRDGASHELVIGAELARRLHLDVGSKIPPFYRNEGGEFVSTVVGIFGADLPVWQAHLMFCSLETAAIIFSQKDLVTDFLIDCEPGYTLAMSEQIAELPTLAAPDAHGPIEPVVTARDDLHAALPRNLRHYEGIFQIHFLLAFAVGIPLLMVTSGLGLSERRREAALLKATGWMTDEVLMLSFVESVVLATVGASISVILAWIWLVPLKGAGLAGIFLPGVETDPALVLPFELAPVPLLLTSLIALSIVTIGSIYSTWRAATTSPALALR